MSGSSSEDERSREKSWARPVSRLKVTETPAGAINLNLEGRQVMSPLQGFGPLWQKTYRIRLPGVTATPVEIMKVWKERFPEFQPPGNRFYPSVAGVQPGEIIFIESSVSPRPGVLPGIPVASGVMVLYADDESFTVMTPQGFPESGWNTFSVYSQEGETWAQVQSMCRATDPVFEFGFRFMGGSRFQEETWQYVLTSLAAHFKVTGEQVQMTRVCVDPKLQWSQARNVWHNAMIRSMLYMPFHLARKVVKRGA